MGVLHSGHLLVLWVGLELEIVLEVATHARMHWKHVESCLHAGRRVRSVMDWKQMMQLSLS